MSMGLLSYNELCKLIDDGVITNVAKSKVNSSSIDITLGTKFFIENNLHGGMSVVSLKHRQSINLDAYKFSEDVFSGIQECRLFPGQFMLAQSEQEFYLPDNISAEYKLKSSMARIGLEHMNAGWCDAGWHGSVLTLEFKNMTQHHVIELKKGDPIGQVVFFRHELVPEHASYRNRGRYNNDKEVTGIKP